MSRRRRREERSEGLPPPTQKPNPSATLYLFRVSVAAGVPGHTFATRFRGTVMPATMFGTCARCWSRKRRELYASLEGWRRSAETRLQEAAPTGACRRSSSPPPRAQHRGRPIAITPIGAHGHPSAGRRTSADLGPTVVTSSVGDDLGRDSVWLWQREVGLAAVSSLRWATLAGLADRREEPPGGRPTRSKPRYRDR
jgi:hypothetical protein